ncbi:MAG: Calx-beta domain-containing protein, partial [Geitlerinemataceae cyanobacterium]
MADIALWNFNDDDFIADGGVRADSIATGGGGLNNVRFAEFALQAQRWGANAAFDAASDDFFKFTVDLTDYHNIQFSLLEREKTNGDIAGPDNYALAYQIGDGEIEAVQTNLPTTPDNFADAPTVFDLSGVAALQTLNNDNATPKNVSFYLFGYNQPDPENSNSNWRIDDVTITGDILPSKFSIAATDATDANKAEGNDGTTPFTFTITRTADIQTAATVSYNVAGTGANTATLTDDFLPGTATVGFAAGQDTAEITIDVVGDTTAEPDEEFTVTLDGSIDTA